jgi:hypothetical protein
MGGQLQEKFRCYNNNLEGGAEMPDARHTNRLFTTHGAASILERDRGTIMRCVRELRPDGRDDQGRPMWALANIVRALARNSDVTGADGGVIDPICDEIGRVAAELDAGFSRVASEPDLEKRRAMLREVAPAVGQLDKMMRRCNEAQPESRRALLETAREVVLGRNVANVLGLGNWTVEGWPA